MANIRTARRSGLVLRGGRQVRETLWGDVVSTFTTLAPGGAVLLNVTGTIFLNLRPWTIVRSRGFLHLGSDQTPSVEQQAADFGICVVSDQAVGIGITALPTPVTDRASDLWQTYVTLMGESTRAISGNGGYGTEYDSKAMRKVEDGSQLVFIIEAEAAALTQGCNVRHSGRILIKLH